MVTHHKDFYYVVVADLLYGTNLTLPSTVLSYKRFVGFFHTL